jgi:signal transduction histidine kinase
MPNLPTARQTLPGPTAAQTRAADRRSLEHAFRTFTQAAGSLEKSYAQLQGEVARLRADLECANAELSRSLEETSQVRQFLARILEGLPCGVLVSDGQGQPRLLNPEARRLLGVDMHWTPEQNEWCPAALARLLAENSPEAFPAEREWSTGLAGDARILGLSARRGEPCGTAEAETIWILRDASAEKRLAAEREAARRAHALAEIAAVLAHEIRNPLGSMELFTGLLAGATAGMPEAHQWVQHLQAGLRSLGATVNNVLQFHGQPGTRRVATRLDRLVQETAEFLGPLARQRGLRLAVHNRLGAVSVAADAQRLQQVFFNLSLNAFHAMEAGGTLGLRLRAAENRPEGWVRVDFEDEGSGIEAALRNRIFEPGFTTKAGSPGLGLAVCRQVIEQHGGEIAVEGRVPRGSRFSVYLPLQEGLR